MAEPRANQRTLFRTATVVTLLAVMMGSLVCATESGMACPTWPGCFEGQLVPGFHLPPWIEFSHRLVSGACLILLIFCGISAWSSQRSNPWVRWLPWVAVVGALAAAVFGMSIIFWGLSAPLGALDLLCSLVALIAITTATAALERGGLRWRWRPSAIAGTATVVALLAMHAGGILVAGTGSFTRCMGWPLWSLLSYDGHTGGQIARWVLAGLAFAGMAALAVTATGRAKTLALVAAGLLVIEAGLAMLIITSGLNNYLSSSYSLIATLILWFVTLATVLDATAQPAEPRPVSDEQHAEAGVLTKTADRSAPPAESF